MKKFITAPALLLLVCSFAACGKTDSASPVAAGQPLVANPAPYPGTQPAGDFNIWCNQRGGLYYASHAVCKIQETTQFGWNMYWGGIDTRIPVYMNDTVSILVSGSPAAVVGGVSYPAASTFVSHSQGNLVLQASGTGSFKIKSIQLTRCYNHNYQSVQCPI
jgi:hypothetical protein